jgi:hypothetical protein
MIRALAILGACLALVSAPRPCRAQGVAGAAVSGRVAEAGGGAVEGAEVQLRNPRTGDTFTTTSGARGEYAFEHVPPGGPYLLTAQAAGYQVTSRGGLHLGLGQRLHVALELELAAGGVEVVEIVETIDRLYDRGRTGPSSTVTDPLLRGLPLQGRNFTDLVLATPHAYALAGASSIAGQNPRLNNIQIDGGSSNDLFGASFSGTPGGTANAKPISIEALKEFVVDVAPFDVRHGRFTGGLVNAITRSGDNELHGGAFTYFQSKALAGRRDDPRFLDYRTWQLGGHLGGPILEDKLHFFVATDLQERHADSGELIKGVDADADRAVAGFDNAVAERFRAILRTRDGIDAGDALAAEVANPDRNLFVKLSTSLIEDSHLELSYNLVDASLDVVSRQPLTPRVPGRLREGYQLSNSGYVLPSTSHALRAKLTSTWGRISNELLLGVAVQEDDRLPASPRPLILVKAGQIGASDAWLAAGGDRFSQANRLLQRTFQLQDTVTLALGRHRLTAGTSNDLLLVESTFLQAAHGVWVFDSLDAFEAGTASLYQRRFDLSGARVPGATKWSAAQLGLYAQDQWSVTPDLTLVAGLRLDVPLLSPAETNPTLAASPSLPIDTGVVPGGDLLWSPRLGVNWDVLGDASTIVRGGAGVFSGRPVYLWVGNAYRQNGMSQVELTCLGATGVPAFTPDPAAQPSDCAGGDTPPSLPADAGEVDFFDRGTRYPQNLRLALGVDRRLPWGLVGTLDAMFTRELNGWILTDENLVDLGASGEGRRLYGTFGSTGFRPAPTRLDDARLDQAIRVGNTGGGEVWTATAQLQKTLRGRHVSLEASAAYTYSRERDRMSLNFFQLVDMLMLAPLDGTIHDRNVRPGAFDRPHKITVAAVAALPFGLSLGLTYIGQSGQPYTWTVSGDVNADGISGNDLVYVPAGEGDLSLQPDPNDPDQAARLDRFIEGQDCLREARGKLLQRGACRNPWQDLVNLRLGWTSPPLHRGGHRLEVQLDVFNLMNLIDGDWGLFRQATGAESHGAAFLRAVGHDAARNRPIYSFAAPANVVTTVFSPTLSRWRIQLGARYSF